MKRYDVRSIDGGIPRWVEDDNGEWVTYGTALRLEKRVTELKAERDELEAGLKYWQTCTMDLRAKLEAVRGKVIIYRGVPEFDEIIEFLSDIKRKGRGDGR
ncbi:MAG: hypothetical protein ACWGSD_11080 [Thermodesulfobacteriota bacterium]